MKINSIKDCYPGIILIEYNQHVFQVTNINKDTYETRIIYHTDKIEIGKKYIVENHIMGNDGNCRTLTDDEKIKYL